MAPINFPPGTSYRERLFIQTHEIMHAIYAEGGPHLTIRVFTLGWGTGNLLRLLGNTDEREHLWEQAADYVINQTLSGA